MNEENTEWYKKGYAQAEADQEALIKKLMQDITDLNNARMSLLEDIGLINLCDSSVGSREAVILECIVAAINSPEPDAWDVAEHIAKSFGYAVVEDDKGDIKLDVEAFRNGDKLMCEKLEGYTEFLNKYSQAQQDRFDRVYSREPEKLVKFLQEKKATWVERQVPEHLEDAAHDLITALLKSHGYDWEGAKQESMK